MTFEPSKWSLRGRALRTDPIPKPRGFRNDTDTSTCEVTSSAGRSWAVTTVANRRESCAQMFVVKLAAADHRLRSSDAQPGLDIAELLAQAEEDCLL